QTLSQAQFDALVSFAFSIGPESFAPSQVLRRLNAGEFDAAACAMDAWRKSDVSGETQVLHALVRRRAAEKAMFLKDMPREAAPSVFVRAKLDHAASVLGAPIEYSTTPALGSVPVAPQETDVAARLKEVMHSEPATNVLLLTQVVTQDAGEDEIVTAHAKPVARKIEAPELPADDRVSPEAGAGVATRTRPLFPSGVWSLEGVGFGALLLFGLMLIGIGGSILLQGRGDGVALMGASALVGPGIAATLMALWGVVRAPRPRAS
ncbi:MAG: lysozyme, partial [Proteobacteria bacterium]|nr:lysozyme [Pseudomonadota bacterium]